MRSEIRRINVGVMLGASRLSLVFCWSETSLNSDRQVDALTLTLSNSFDVDQFLRHHQIAFTRAQLENWDISYHIIDQRAGQFVIILPRVYHSTLQSHFYEHVQTGEAPRSRWRPSCR